MVSKKICVVGAGLSGLCTVKELKEAGHTVLCYEKKRFAGGVFGNGIENNAYDSLSLTVSNYFMAYSGFPISTSEPRRYWSGAEYGDYLQRYIKSFGLLAHMQLSSTVMEIKKHQQGYQVSVENASGELSTTHFDAVVICTGTNRVPYIPQIPAAELFQGKVMHTDDYTNAHEFADKKVLCIGLGESGAELAREIADVAQSCIAVTRSRPSVVPRWINNQTGDAYTSKSFNALGKKGINLFMQLKAKWHLALSKNLSATEKLHFEGLAENKHYVNKFLTKNDEFMHNICEGSLEVKYTTIRQFTKTGVILDDGSELDVDCVMFNTGYSEDFKFVGSFVQLKNIRDLYKHMFHPELGHNFALIGWSRPSQGGVPACSEMQARYLALLLTEERTLPAEKSMRQYIEIDRHWEESYFNLSRHLTGLVDYHQYITSLAKLIGCTPKVSWLTSPKLKLKLWFGTHLANFYRLNGPGQLKARSQKLILALPVAPSLSRNIMVTLITMLFSPIILWDKIRFKAHIKSIEKS